MTEGIAPGDGGSATPSRPPVWLLVAVTALTAFSLHILIPAMPRLAEEFDADSATVQLTLTLYLAGIAGGQLLYGPLSDRFGRRPVLISGLLVFVFASGLCAFARSAESLVIARALQAVGACSGMVLGRAIVRDVFERDKAASVIAYITMAMAVAPAVSPAIGGYLAERGAWRLGFISLAGVGALACLAAWYRLFETNLYRKTRLDPSETLRDIFLLLGSRRYLGYVFNGAFTMTSWYAFLGGVSYVLVDVMQRPASDYGLYAPLMIGAYIAGNFSAGRISERIGGDRMILLGVGVSGVGVTGLLALAVLGSVHQMAVFGPMAVSTFGNGLSQPNAMAGALSEYPPIAGSASGLMGFIHMITCAAATLLVGQLGTRSHLPLAALIFSSIALAFVAYLFARWPSSNGNAGSDKA